MSSLFVALGNGAKSPVPSEYRVLSRFADFAALIRELSDRAALLGPEKSRAPWLIPAEASSLPWPDRKDTSIARVNALFLDCDGKGAPFAETLAAFSRVTDYLDEAQIAWLAYTTHSFKIEERCALRLIVSINPHAITRDRWKPVYGKVCDLFSEISGLPNLFDRACSNPARFYYVPGACSIFDDSVNLPNVLPLEEVALELAREPSKKERNSNRDKKQPKAAEIAGSAARRAFLERLTWAAQDLKGLPFPGQIYASLNASAFGLSMFVHGGFATLDEISQALHVALSERVGGDNVYCSVMPGKSLTYKEKNEAIILKGYEDARNKTHASHFVFFPSTKINDSDLAELAVTIFGSSFRWVDDRQVWAEYDAISGLWRDCEHPRALSEDLKTYLFEAITERETEITITSNPTRIDWIREEIERIQAAIRYLCNAKNLSSLSAYVRKIGSCSCKSTDFDTRADLLKVRNGVVDLKTGTLLENDPSYLQTLSCSADFLADRVSDTWVKSIAAWFPNPETQRFVKRLCGYMLTGDRSEQCLSFFVGDGANGKSTFLQTLIHALGDYATVANGSYLATLGAVQGRAEQLIAYTQSKRLCVVDEGDVGKLSQQTIKLITNEGKVTARNLYEKSRKIDVRTYFVLTANSLPDLHVDKAIERRVRGSLVFGQSFEGVARDLKLQERLKTEEEISGVLSWCVEGAKEWYSTGLGSCEEVSKLTEDLKNFDQTMDLDGVIKAFLSERGGVFKLGSEEDFIPIAVVKPLFAKFLREMSLGIEVDSFPIRAFKSCLQLELSRFGVRFVKETRRNENRGRWGISGLHLVAESAFSRSSIN